jgi:hypothetical protein
MKSLIKVAKNLKNKFFLDKNEKNFINFNLKKYSNQNLFENLKKKKKEVVLLDLFPWNPWIIIWSFLINFLCKKFKANAEFFYVDLYQNRFSNYELSIRKLKKIFKSFNVKEGINEYKFKYLNNELDSYKNLFKSLGKKKEKLVNFRYKGYDVGLLIYDTYVRISGIPTVNFEDPKLEKVFIRGLKVLNEGLKYFKKNNVRCVVPSHLCYVSYGIITRIAIKKNIPVIKIYSKFRGNASYRIHRIKDIIVDEAPYYDFKKTFAKFDNKKKIKFRKIGKEIIKKRISGKYDNNLPYMKISQFNKKLKTFNLINKKKRKIFLFPHCYFDNPHKYRWMLFPDFYEQINFLLNLSLETNDFEWYYKPHPNELNKELNIHKEFLKRFPNVIYLDQFVGHNYIIKSKPYLIITNHGKVCHEYAYFNIPVINTGDNAHINYKFSLNPKDKEQLKDMILNLNKYKKFLDYNKKNIYEYLYMDFYHYNSMYNKDLNFNDKFFSTKKKNFNNSSKIFSYFIKNLSIKREEKIQYYLKQFYEKMFI